MTKLDLVNYLATAVNIFSNLLVYAIIARIILSWFSFGQMGFRNRIVQFLYEVTDPVINFFKIIPHRIGMIDLSPMIALFAIDILSYLIIELLYKLAGV